ncbi:MAG: hypothetical protein K6F84_04465 [Lachnospiraceae bacterium]|nr:hypothetical protein [Lachnospiraceae bacterium]
MNLREACEFLENIDYTKGFNNYPLVDMLTGRLAKRLRIDVTDNLEPSLKGWNWLRVTGPCEERELYYSNIFSRDFGAAVFSYRYMLDAQEIRKILVKSDEDFQKELNSEKWLYSIGEEIDYFLDASKDKEPDYYDIARSLLCGSLYFYCRTNNGDFPKDIEEIWGKKETVFNMEYYESIVDDIYYYFFFEPQAKEEISGELISYLLDVVLSFKMDPYSEITPTLFIFSSESYCEYQRIKDLIPKRYKTALEKAAKFLEDPTNIEFLTNPERTDASKLFRVEPCDLESRDDISASVIHGINKTYWIYYFFDSYEGTKTNELTFSPILFIVRECFEKVFAHAKRHLSAKIHAT